MNIAQFPFKKLTLAIAVKKHAKIDTKTSLFLSSFTGFHNFENDCRSENLGYRTFGAESIN